MKMIRKALASPGLMLAFSSVARSFGFVFPVPLFYIYGSAAESTLWLAIGSIVSLQNLFFLGLPQVLVRTLSTADVAHDKAPAAAALAAREQALQDACQFIRLIFSGVSLLQFIGLATLGTWVLLRPFGQLANPADGIAAWVVVVLFSPARVFTLRQLTFLNGMGDLATPRLVDGLAWSLGGTSAALALWLSGSMLLMTLAVCLPSLVAIPILRSRAAHHGWNRFTARFEWQRVRSIAVEIWRPTWRSGLGTLLSTGARQGTGLLFIQVGSPAAASAYLLAQNVITVCMVLSAAPVQAKLHLMTRAYVKGERQLQATLLRSTIAESLWVASSLCVAIGLGFIPALSLLGESAAFVSPQMWAAMSMALLLQRYGAVHLQSYSVSNHIIWHWLDGITGMVNVCFSMVFLPSLGLWAIVLGNLVSIAFFYCWIPAVYSHRLLRMTWPKDDAAAWWRPAAFSLVSLCVCIWVIPIAVSMPP
ncbi:hypothetical protein LJR235_004709 [Pararhizobium sp. LjRoot235]|uniref:hypothetical protein n=1 Tax=Pararhizobium sp. LjRoot235 TaxID=3342291 RepID=UPI003ECF37F8